MRDTPYTPEQIQSAQRLRVRRCLGAALFYGISGTILAVAKIAGLFPGFALNLMLTLFAATSFVFWATIRSGANLRFADPSLTEAQIAAALLNCTLVLVFAGPLRGVVMLAYVVPLQFGAFALPARRLLRLCLIPAIGLPLAMAGAEWLNLRGATANVEIVQWIALLLVLPFTATIAGRLYEYGRYKRLSDTDELSGLYNRRAAFAYLDQLTRMSQANRGTFSVALIDLDHFKQVNDRYGHAMGDRVIRSFADIARGALRKGDLIARWGGEEFLAVLHGPPEHARTSIERLREALAGQLVAGLPEPVTLSAGIAQHQPGQSLPDLIDLADGALYAAKHSGRNRVALAAAPDERRGVTPA